jgi:hypothetical protein
VEKWSLCILTLLKHAHFSYVTKQKGKGKFMSFFNAEYLFIFLWPLWQWTFDGNPGFVKGIMRGWNLRFKLEFYF